MPDLVTLNTAPEPVLLGSRSSIVAVTSEVYPEPPASTTTVLTGPVVVIVAEISAPDPDVVATKSSGVAFHVAKVGMPLQKVPLKIIEL